MLVVPVVNATQRDLGPLVVAVPSLGWTTASVIESVTRSGFS
jgi:hypothetical protein